MLRVPHKQRIVCSGYHTVCAKHWHGHSPCVVSMLRRLRSPEASSRGSSSIIFSCVISFSSGAGTLVIGFPMAFCLSKSLVFSSPSSRVLLPRSHSSHLFVPLAPFPGSSVTRLVETSISFTNSASLLGSELLF